MRPLAKTSKEKIKQMILSAKWKGGRKHDIYLVRTCYIYGRWIFYLSHYFDSFSVRACGRKLRLVFTKKLGLIKKMVQPKCLLTFEPVNLLLQLGHRPLGELSTSLSLVENGVINYHLQSFLSGINQNWRQPCFISASLATRLSGFVPWQGLR